MNSFGTHLPLVVNLGKELSEFFALKEKGEIESARVVATRAEGIIDSLLVNPDLVGGGIWEMKKWREIMNDALSDEPQFSVSKLDVEIYFRPFALRLYE